MAKKKIHIPVLFYETNPLLAIIILLLILLFATFIFFMIREKKILNAINNPDYNAHRVESNYAGMKNDQEDKYNFHD